VSRNRNIGGGALLFDRLTDKNPVEPAEKQPFRVLYLDDFLESVAREISSILNTRSHGLGPLEPTGESNDLDTPLEEGTALPCAAGDVLFFNYLTIHGSGVNRSTRTRRNVLFQYRDPEDMPLRTNGVEEHVDWGQGLMVAGRNPVYWQTRPTFEIKAA